MKKITRLLALCMALMLALSMTALGEGTDAAQEPAESVVPETAQTSDVVLAEENPVLFTFDGTEVRWAEVNDVLVELVANARVEENDYASAVEYLIEEMAINAKAKELGLDQFTDDEKEAFLTEAQAEWDAAIDSYVTYFLTEDTEEARAKAKADGEAYYQARGIDLAYIVDYYMENEILTRFLGLIEDSDVKAQFEQSAALYKETFENDVAGYENEIQLVNMYAQYGYIDSPELYLPTSWYRPAGYRGITHILLEVDADLLSAYENAQAAYEETLSQDETAAEATTTPAEGETAEPTAAPVTQEDVAAARAAVLESRQADIDAIYDRLEKGESFESLIAEFGTDPGMQDETTLKEGYAVHQSSILYDPAFTSGAYSEKMQKPGDVSDPVVGMYGIHILNYLRDIPEGNAEMSDAVRTEIQITLLNQQIASWVTEHEVVRMEDAISALTPSTTEAE